MATIVAALLVADASVEVEVAPTAESLDQLSLFDLLNMNVVVSSTGDAQNASGAPSIIVAIDREDIERHDYSSVADALQSVPGIYVGYDYAFYDVGVRGLTGEMRGRSRLIKVMIDGQPIPVRTENINLLGPELLPLDAVERIEVIRGPSSVLYGANAFMGVVNIITRKGADVAGTLIRAEGQRFGGRKGGGGALVLGGRYGSVDLLLALHRYRTDRSGQRVPCTTFPEADDPCAEQRSRSLEPTVFDRASFDDISQPSALVGTLNWELPTVGGVALGRLEGMAHVQSLDTRASFADWSVLQYDALETDGSLIAPVKNSGNRVAMRVSTLRERHVFTALDDAFEVRSSVAYSGGGITDNERLRDSDGFQERSRYGFDSLDLAVESRLTLLNPDEPFSWIKYVAVAAGADTTYDSIRVIADATAVPKKYVNPTLRTSGLFGQFTGSLFDDRIGFIAAMRRNAHRGMHLLDTALGGLNKMEADRLCGNQVCYARSDYRLGLTLTWWRDDSFSAAESSWLGAGFMKILWGTAFQAPSPLLLYGDPFLGRRKLNPNPGLAPQQTKSLEVLLGIKAFDSRLEASVTGFVNSIENVATFTKVGLGMIARNDFDVKSRGVEVQGEWNGTWVHGTVSGAWQKSEKQFTEIDDLNRIPETFGYPGLLVGGSIGNTSYLGLQATLDARYVSSRVGHFLTQGGGDRTDLRYELKPYTITRLALAWRDIALGPEVSLDAILTIDNIFNATYAFPGYQPYFRVDTPGLPRVFRLSWVLTF